MSKSLQPHRVQHTRLSQYTCHENSINDFIKWWAEWITNWNQDYWENLRYADDTTLMVEGEEELNNLLKRVKEVGEK